MADAEKHTIIAENIFNVFDLVCEWSLHDEDERPSAAMMAVALLATPGFDECGLPQSWFDFAEKYPKVAATLRAGAKVFAIPGNKTMEEESEKGLPIFYLLNPICQSGCRLNPPEKEEPGPGPRAGLRRGRSKPGRICARMWSTGSLRRRRGSSNAETSLPVRAFGGRRMGGSGALDPRRKQKQVMQIQP